MNPDNPFGVETPIGLKPALAALAVGFALLVWIAVQLFVELRRRRRVRQRLPSRDGLDRDLVRYVERVGTLVLSWEERLGADRVADALETFEAACTLVWEVQRLRLEGGETAWRVSRLAALERELEAQITKARG